MDTTPIINIDDLSYDSYGHGDQFACQMGEIAQRIGGRQLGYNLTVIPAGKRAFPLHSHHVNEEMFFILEGQGELRTPQHSYPLRAGDVVACPTGGPETAHQIINTMAQGDLKFLAVSTTRFPDICEYPDSGKFGVRHYWTPTDSGEEKTLRFIVKQQATDEDYWDGE